MKRCPQCDATYRGGPSVCPIDGAPLVSVADDNLGRSIGGWTIEELLADGKLAAVYRARQGSLLGALKLYGTAAPLQRRWHELMAQRRVVHPNVAAFLDGGVSAEGEAFLVTELVAGQTLRQLLYAERPAWSRAVALAAQIAAGLDAVHRAGLVHRDLKPENMMIPERPGDPLRLLDLGHALVLDVERLTESGLVWGSAPYMAPEQAAGLPTDGRADLYSLGVVLYEMLVGQRPFVAKAAVELMRMHWSHVPPAPGTRVSVPGAVSELCMWLLAKRAEERPPDARVARAALLGTLTRGQNDDVPQGGFDVSNQHQA